MQKYDVLVIGGGPAGLSAAISANSAGASVLLIEREGRLGGILKQCIHDGFGLVRFKEQLTGPEYAECFIKEFMAAKIPLLTLTFVTDIQREGEGFRARVVNREGIHDIYAKTLILATGCRERTARQIGIHGTRPAGVLTAGAAQLYVNILGQMPTKKCVILGSGDIGLIMARRLSLEGAEVLGVYEAKSSPSGLMRNVHQCLNDYNIPLHLSHTVTRVFGDMRLEGVEISQVDENMQPIAGTESRLDCDALILSVGLIPENELAESLGVEIDPRTKGPVCDNLHMTSVGGVFSCGNALHVSDLVDYVSESGEIAGLAAGEYAGGERHLASLKSGENMMYLVPQLIDLNAENKKTILFFRSNQNLDNSRLSIEIDGEKVFEKKYAFLRPPEMERLEIDFSKYEISEDSEVLFNIMPIEKKGGGEKHEE